MTKHIDHTPCKHLQFFSSNWFFSTPKGCLSIFFPILYPESFMLCKETVYNGLNLRLYTPFDFKLKIQSAPLYFFNLIYQVFLDK